MHLESTAFVLRTHPLGEADRIVALFTRDAGQVRCVAPGAATSRKRFAGSLSVLAEVEVRVRTRPGRDLARLESCELQRPTPGEGRDLEAFYAATYLAEVLEAFSREAEPDDRLYRLTRSCADSLAVGLHPQAVCRYFEIWTLKLAGLLPDLGRCTGCGRELARTGLVCAAEGEAACRECGGAGGPGSRSLSAAAVARVERFLREPPETALRQAASLDELRAIATFAVGQFLLLVERPFRTAAAVVPRRRRAQKPVGDLV